MPAAVLPKEAQLLALERLACFEGPTEVAREIEREFGVKVSPQAIERFDPNKNQGKTMRPALREKFFKIRQAFRNAVEQEPMASKTFRLRALARVYDEAIEKGDYKNANKAIELAAKEMEGMGDPRTGLTIEQTPEVHEGLSPERIDELAAQFMEGMRLLRCEREADIGVAVDASPGSSDPDLGAHRLALSYGDGAES
jgi:hypothetical protein